MVNSVLQYRKMLSKKLLCTRKVKKKLLYEFDSAISGYLDENESPDGETLYVAFGPPEEMAMLLMSKMTLQEQAYYLKVSRVKRIINIALIALLTAFIIYVLFVKEFRITSIDETYEIVGESYVDNFETWREQMP